MIERRAEPICVLMRDNYQIRCRLNTLTRFLERSGEAS
jgi:hypothetical protein